MSTSSARTPSYEGLVARIVADYAQSAADRRAGVDRQARRRAGRRRVLRPGRRDHRATAAALVHPRGRGLGLGGRLVDTRVEFARDAGYERMRPWTNSVMETAQAPPRWLV
jgi:GNAT superfamily N-acetyltransferase